MSNRYDGRSVAVPARTACFLNPHGALSHEPETRHPGHRPEAQRRFDQGLNLLHGFMYFDAYRAFVSGSTCASGMLMIQYEGMFMLAPVHVRFSEWQQAADYLSSCVSDNANAMLFRDGLLAYCLAMEKLLQPQPPPILT